MPARLQVERDSIRQMIVNNKELQPIWLVPRPFPPPVFDRLQYAKTEGEGLGERVTCVTPGRHEGAVLDEEF